MTTLEIVLLTLLIVVVILAAVVIFFLCIDRDSWKETATNRKENWDHASTNHRAATQQAMDLQAKLKHAHRRELLAQAQLCKIQRSIQRTLNRMAAERSE